MSDLKSGFQRTKRTLRILGLIFTAPASATLNSISPERCSSARCKVAYRPLQDVAYETKGYPTTPRCAKHVATLQPILVSPFQDNFIQDNFSIINFYQLPSHVKAFHKFIVRYDAVVLRRSAARAQDRYLYGFYCVHDNRAAST